MSSKNTTKRVPIVALAGCLCALSGMFAGPRAHAMPPAAALTSSLSEARWLTHAVIPGERLRDIAEHYAVSVGDIVRWNKLPEKHARIRAGQDLRIRSLAPALVRKRRVHRVKRGDTWSGLAHKNHVSMAYLRRWNAGHEDLQVGDKIILWLPVTERASSPRRNKADEAGTKAAKQRKGQPLHAADEGDDGAHEGSEQEDESLSVEQLDAKFPIVAVTKQSQSVGRPGRGRIRRALQMPQNDKLYRLRDPSHSYASSHTIMVLQQAISRFRHETGFSGEVVFNDLSRRNGGRLSPHRSHQSGRDADIRLPLVPGTERDNGSGQVDWDATWALMNTMIESGQVRYIFLSRPQQRALRRAAQRAGVGEDKLSQLLQFPGSERTAVIRHSPGHDRHFHVRIACAEWESLCSE